MQFTNEEIINNKIRKYKSKKIISIIIYVLILPFILYSIFLIIQAFIIPNKIPNFLEFKTFIIDKENNEFNLGDIILAKEVPENNIQIDDVIFFRKNNNIVSDRIVEIRENKEDKMFITKGDIEGNNFYIKYNEIEGIYSYKIFNLGKFILFFQKNIIFISTLLIFYFLYFYKASQKRKSFIRKKKRERFNEEFDT